MANGDVNMSDTPDVILSLTSRENQIILDALARRPWIEVTELIGKVVGQAQAQNAIAAQPRNGTAAAANDLELARQ